MIAAGPESTQDSVLGKSSFAEYEKLGPIKPGAFGYVYLGEHKHTKQRVALKKMFIELEGDGFPSSSIREISLLREVNSPYIIKLLDILIEERTLYLVLEYVQRDLKDFLQHTPKGIHPELVQKLMYQLLQGLDECHSKRIIHRDLKPANILIDNSLNLKIADFGLARTYQIPIRPYSHEVVTLYYRAPEILLGSLEYSTPIDIWSVGCIFAEMLTGNILFFGDSEIDQLFRIFRTLGTPKNSDWPGVDQLPDYRETFPNWKKQSLATIFKEHCTDQSALDLLSKMLCYDPVTRVTAREALKHPYFSAVRGCTKFFL